VVDDGTYESARDWTLWELHFEPGIWEVWWEVGGSDRIEGVRRRELLECSRRLLRELYAEGWAQFVRLADKDDLANVGVPGHVLAAEEVEAAIADPGWSERPDIYGRWIVLRPTAKWRAWREARDAK
jgi:hypothetical protein